MTDAVAITMACVSVAMLVSGSGVRARLKALRERRLADGLYIERLERIQRDLFARVDSLERENAALRLELNRPREATAEVDHD